MFQLKFYKPVPNVRGQHNDPQNNYLKPDLELYLKQRDRQARRKETVAMDDISAKSGIREAKFKLLRSLSEIKRNEPVSSPYEYGLNNRLDGTH